MLNKLLFAFDRVVILSPACADIFEKLHAEDKVVGVTRHIKGFIGALRVGSHIKPNVEIIAGLKPDLVIYSNEKFFPKMLKNKINAKFYRYDPRSLEKVFDEVEKIGDMIGKSDVAEKLVNSLRKKLTKIKKLKRKPTVVYEVMYVPYILAGQKSIVNDIIKIAGGENLIKINKKLVRFSLEKAISLKPDIYIYQIGPMNKKAPHPSKRPEFKGTRMEIIKVNELLFSRANTNSVEAVLKLNEIFYKWSLQ